MRRNANRGDGPQCARCGDSLRPDAEFTYRMVHPTVDEERPYCSVECLAGATRASIDEEAARDRLYRTAVARLDAEADDD